MQRGRFSLAESAAMAAVRWRGGALRGRVRAIRKHFSRAGRATQWVYSVTTKAEAHSCCVASTDWQVDSFFLRYCYCSQVDIWELVCKVCACPCDPIAKSSPSVSHLRLLHAVAPAFYYWFFNCCCYCCCGCCYCFGNLETSCFQRLLSYYSVVCQSCCCLTLSTNTWSGPGV